MTRSIKHLFLCIIAVIALSLIIFADIAAAQQDKNSDAGYVFYKANTLYEQGSYDEAISEYSKLLSQGMESGNLYYNLGNCYFKKGETGKAILNYERSKRLIPRDSDLSSNYTFALSQLMTQSADTSISWTKKATGIFNNMSINELTVIISAIFIVTILFMIVRLFIPFRRRSFYALLSSLFIIFIFIAFSLFNRVSLIDKEAVVIVESTEARFEPFENATIHFTLYEGTKLYVVQSKKDWSKIKRPDGKAGWIKIETIEKI